MSFSIRIFALLLVAHLALAQGIRLPSYTQAQADEAYRYTVKTVSPVLESFMSNPATLPALRNRLVYFFRQLSSGKVDYQALPVINPACVGCPAKIDYDLRRKIPQLLLFVPVVKKLELETQWSLGQKAFENYLGFIFAHEVVHLELARQQKYSLERRAHGMPTEIQAEEEAEAWGISLLEIVRPLLKQGQQFPKNVIRNSEELRKVGDNYHHAAWIQAFRRQQQGR